MNKYGFTDTEWQETLAVFKKYAEIEKVALFGSRAKNTFKPMSDVDIVLFGDKINHSLIASLQSDFEDSQIPYMFDILHYEKITSDELKQHIKVYGKAILGGNNIPNGWVETTLGEVVDSANTGLDAIKRAPIVEEETGIKCFRVQDASQKKKYNNWGNTKVEDKNYQKFRLVKGDILIARTGNTIGVNHLVKEDIKAVFNNGLIRLRVNNSCDYTFLYKIIESRLFDRYVQSIAYGTSTQPNMKINVLLGFDLLLPPIKEQVAIAKILTAFDDKIELLQAQNKILETTAQTIFKEWFGKYQIGDELPDGWRVGKLGDIIDIFDSKRIPLSKAEREEKKGEFRYYGATSVMDYIDEYLFDGIYLLFSEDGSVIDDNGNPFLQYVWGQFWVNNHTHILQGRNGYSTEMLYVLCKKMRVAGIVNGAVQLKINQNNLLNFEVVIPDEGTLSKFDKTIQPLFMKLRLNNDEIQTLKKIRDTLLPKLMSGELRVKL